VATAAEKLLESMRRTKSGWGQDDLHTLYLGFGFWCREGRKHRVYIHSEFPELRATVARQDELPIGYVQMAIRLTDRLEELRRKAKEEGGP